MLAWVVTFSLPLDHSVQHPRLSASSRVTSHLSLVTKSPVVHPLSVQQLTKCPSPNSFVLITIHFDGGVHPLNEEIMNPIIANSCSTIDIPAVASRHNSSLQHPLPAHVPQLVARHFLRLSDGHIAILLFCQAHGISLEALPFRAVCSISRRRLFGWV